MAFKVKYIETVDKNLVETQGAKDVYIQILIGPEDGSSDIILRKFTVKSKGNTPYHKHAWPHLIKVEKGEGYLISADSKQKLTEGMVAFVKGNEYHQFKNLSDEDFSFLCIIPNPEKY